MAKRGANGEASIRKRKDGRWEGWYTKPTLGDIPLEKLAAMDLQRLYKQLLEDGRVACTEVERHRSEEGCHSHPTANPQAERKSGGSTAENKKTPTVALR